MNLYKKAISEIAAEKKISEKEILEKLPFLKKMTEEH